MVEMAIVTPLFILLLFGIMEAGWLFSQQVEVRHGAREATRIAAVSTPDIDGSGTFDAADIRDRACNAMNLSSGTVTRIAISSTGADIGDDANVTVVVQYQSLTGVADSIFDGLSIDTSVDFRLEQPRAWSDATYVAVAPASVCP